MKLKIGKSNSIKTRFNDPIFKTYKVRRSNYEFCQNKKKRDGMEWDSTSTAIDRCLLRAHHNVSCWAQLRLVLVRLTLVICKVEGPDCS